MKTININEKNASIFYIIIQFLYFAALSISTSFAAAYMLDRGFSDGQIGLILGIGCLLNVICQMLIVSFIERTGMRIGHVIVGVNVITMAAAVALMFISGGGVGFAVLFTVLNVLSQATVSFVIALYRGYNEQGIRINFSVGRGFGSAAFSLGGLVGGHVIENFSPDAIPVMYIIPSILFCIFVLLFHAPNVEEKRTAGVTPAEKRVLLRDYPQFYTFFIGAICIIVSHSFTQTYLLQILQHVGGNSANLGTALFISAMMELPAMLLYRKMADRFGNRRLLAFAGFAWILKNFWIMLAPNVYSIYAAELLQFAGYAIYVPAGMRYVAHTLPESEFLKGQALIGSAYTVGSLIANIVGGPMLEHLGLRVTLWGMQLFSVVGIVLYTYAMWKSLRMFPSAVAEKKKGTDKMC